MSDTLDKLARENKRLVRENRVLRDGLKRIIQILRSKSYPLNVYPLDEVRVTAWSALDWRPSHDDTAVINLDGCRLTPKEVDGGE